MPEAAQERSRPGTLADVLAKNLGHPSGGFIAAPKPVVAQKIVAQAEDLAPRKKLHFAAMLGHWLAIGCLGREAWRAAIVELHHRQPRIRGHRVPRAVLSDSRNVGPPGPLQHC